jgi:hypothetical protein
MVIPALYYIRPPSQFFQILLLDPEAEAESPVSVGRNGIECRIDCRRSQCLVSIRPVQHSERRRGGYQYFERLINNVCKQINKKLCFNLLQMVVEMGLPGRAFNLSPQ